MKEQNQVVRMIGRNRFIVLAVVAATTLLLGGLWQKYFLPQHEGLRVSESAADSDISRLQRELIDLPEKYKALQANEAKYDVLLKEGLLEPQDRILARAKINDIRMQSGLRRIGYNIAPQEKVTHPESTTLGSDIVRSKINVELKGLTDLEMRDFIQKMHHDFGGLVLIKSLELKQDKEADAASLLALSRKTPTDFISGNVVFEWYSISPPATVPDSLQAQAFGGSAP